MCISFPSAPLSREEMIRRAPAPRAAARPPPLRPPRTPSGRPRLRAPGGCSLRALSGRGFGPAPGSAPAVIARICAASPARRGFGGSRRGERGRLGRGGSGQGWAGFFSCLRSGTCKLKPKVPPELMSVLACVCVCVCLKPNCLLSNPSAGGTACTSPFQAA